MPHRRLSLVQKGLLVLLLPLLYQLVLLAVLFRNQRTHTEAQEMAVHTKDVLLQVDRLFTDLLETQNYLRGYTLIGDARFARLGEEHVARIEPGLAALGQLVSDNPQQTARFKRLSEAVRNRLDWHASIMERIDSGQWNDAVEQLKTLRGHEFMNAVRAEIDAFRDTELALDHKRLAQLGRATAQQSWLLGVGLALTLAAGIGSAVLFSRSISQRITTLGENVRRMERGETLVQPVAGGDEIAELDRSFHAMAEGLSQARKKEGEFKTTLEKRNAELTRANRELDQKNQENEMFVYSVSHDLRSPLVNLQGFSKELEMVRNDLRGLLAGEPTEAARQQARAMIERDISEPIQFIQTAVKRLSMIIDALLRLSRAGRVEYQAENVALGAVIARIVQAMHDSVTRRGVTVIQQEKLPAVWGDPTAIEQVFANLIQNAVNYLDPARPGRIEIGESDAAAHDIEGAHVFFVQDNGLGIPEAYLPKVFAIFQRLHAHAAPGEGIGLALVRRMVERHGGHIWVESVAGVGSTFFVALPRKEKSPLIVAPRKESVRLAGPTPPKP